MASFVEREVIGMNEDEVPERIREYLASEDREKATVQLDDLRWVKDRLALRGRFLCQMLRGTETLLPTVPKEPRNPELEARCQRLRREQEEREYRAMTKMVDPKRYKQPEESIAYQMKQINRQLIGVAQFVFSVAAGFMFGFLGLELIFGDLDMGFRIICGISCALVIAVAEIYFLIMHLHIADAPPPDEPETTLDEGAKKSESSQQEKPHQE